MATDTRSRRSSRPLQPRPTSCGASATSSATAAIPTPRSRSRWSTARSAWPATTTSRSSTCSRSRTSRAAPRWPPSGRKETIQPKTREFLLSLSPQGGAEGVGLYHASPRDPIWEYVLSGLTAELCLDATDYRVSFIGHSHVALSFHRNEGESATGSTRREGDELDISAGGWLINPGSTGQPRDGDPRAAWLLLDTEAWTARWRRAEYDIAGAQAAIRAANLPDSLAERLQYGQ